MNHDNLKQRTKQFALDIIGLVESLPNTRTCNILSGQLLRAGTSVGANHRGADRARSPADFISKMGIVEEEADESAFWIDLLISAKKLHGELATRLLQEASELTAIAVASGRTAKRNAATQAKTPLRTPHSALHTPA